MNSLTVNFENCYGIKKLKHSFDFTNGCAHVIYASNGAMKSSFAKIFDDLSKKQSTTTKDRIFSERETVAEIKYNGIDDLNPELVFVIERYKENFSAEKISTLLVNQELRNEYEQILFAINLKKDELVKILQSKSGLKNNLIEDFTKVFNKTGKEFFECLEGLEKDVLNEFEPILGRIKYINIFNDEVLKFLNSKNFKDKLKEYIDTYDQLISKSTYFKKGIFNHNNADTVSKALKSNGFFSAKHSVSLNSGIGKKELETQEELDLEINNEKSKILNDVDLAKKFKEMDDAMIKNVSLREFRSYLENNNIIIPELDDLKGFSKKIWLSYLKLDEELFKELLILYRSGKIEIEKIINQAKKEKTSWEKVAEIFNDRFSVPYKILVKNQDDVILKGTSPSIVFEYCDGKEKKEIGGSELVRIISTGEQRALYLLNIIFEIEIRKNGIEETLLIIDDIADSFDYKNKYAIIEYLKDILESEKFKLIVLTHNFDFYRTILSRLDIDKWTNSLVSIKSETEINLIAGKDNLEIFSKLKKKYHENDAMLVACIPFVRNLVEYTEGSSSPYYRTLTSLLHIKPEKNKDSIRTKGSIYITVKDLEDIFNNVFKHSKSIKDNLRCVFKLIMELCDTLSEEPGEFMNLENKLTLSIGIRLIAEGFMIDKIDNKSVTENIEKNQTAKLLKLYKEKFDDEKDALNILEQVNLMTTENIHLNSFMYEPLMDISDHHLKSLYKKVRSLIIS